jgi:signal transduction histidine kinase
MNSLNTASLINLLGFTAGIALYALLLAMVVRHRRSRDKFSLDFLLLATAILGLLWNSGELFTLVWKDFAAREVSPVLPAVAYSALGFLPSVVVHSVWKNSENENRKLHLLTFSAYGLSVLASFLHFRAATVYGAALSNTALQILTVGSLLLLAGLLIFNFKQTLERKTIWITALLIFVLSALHLRSETEGNSWIVELFAHQSSLPLALAILLQDYRFAFADLFLKRALSLLLLTLTAFGLYVFFAAPLLALHVAHEKNDVQASGILLAFWIATALIYQYLHRFAVWLVDKIILRRADYEKLLIEILNVVEKQETIENALAITCEKLAGALTAVDSTWSEYSQGEAEIRLPTVDFTSYNADIFVPTAESPFYRIHLKNFSGGRRLLSDEIELLQTVSLITARRIDVLRVAGERYNREIREQEFSKLAAEAELRALRAQINPHFLFNALTAIGYLIQTAPDKAFATLMKLTQLLRRVLKTSNEFSTLGEEIELVKSYLEIEQARFEERLQIEIDVAQDLQNLRVPSFILQPLVENAVKHGISKTKAGGIIRIFAGLETENEKSFLKLKISDSGAGENMDEILQRRQTGVGLNNIEQRLHNYYGDSADLKIESESGKGTTAQIKIPVSSASKVKNI